MNTISRAILGLLSIAATAASVAGNQCKGITSSACTAAEAGCIASVDLDPISCGVYYGCCDSGSNTSTSVTTLPTCSAITDPSCQNPSDPVQWPDDPSSSFGDSSAATSYSGVKEITMGSGYPSGASSGTIVVEAAVDVQQHIFYNWWIQGGAARGWREFDGAGRATASPAVTLMQTSMYAAIPQADGYLYFNQGDLAGKFTGWQRLAFQTRLAPALTSSLNTGVIVAVDAQGRTFYSYWNRGASGTPFVQLAGSVTTDAAPAAALVGKYLFVVIKGRDGNVYLNQGVLGKPFVGWKPMGITTNVAPAAGSADSDAIVVIKDPQGQVLYNWWTVGQAGQGWTDLTQTKSPGGATPAIVKALSPPAASVTARSPGVALTTKGYVFVFVTSPAGALQLNQGDVGQPFVGWRNQ
jgi:hypothetical protein